MPKRHQAAQRRKKSRRHWTPRKPTGLRPGELLSEYPQTTVRLPPDVRAQLERVAEHQARQQWRVLVDAIREYAARVLPGESQR
jgi:LmbE family N-acetylglucosaminyl deacetylase